MLQCVALFCSEPAMETSPGCFDLSFSSPTSYYKVKAEWHVLSLLAIYLYTHCKSALFVCPLGFLSLDRLSGALRSIPATCRVAVAVTSSSQNKFSNFLLF